MRQMFLIISIIAGCGPTEDQSDEKVATIADENIDIFHSGGEF